MRVLTIGHSTRTLSEFLALLNEHEVATLVDVRSYPGSRRYPHFGKKRLAQELGAAYVHLEELGGRRRNQEREELFSCIRVKGFRSYAAYLGGEQWERGFESLLTLERPCLMCAEALWWRCHRRLISEVLVARGHEVAHIMDHGPPHPHDRWEIAEYRDGKLYLCGVLAA
jgi:uncharacterized protein (DUF488 family)